MKESQKLLESYNKSLKEDELYGGGANEKVGGDYDDFISELQNFRITMHEYYDTCSTHLAQQIIEDTIMSFDNIVARYEQEKDIEIQGAMNESENLNELDKEKVLNMKYEDLPDMCYGLLPSDNSIIAIKKGETGYWETDYGMVENPEEFVNKLNTRMGVTPEQRMVMELRSMNGNWKDNKIESVNLKEADDNEDLYVYTDANSYDKGEVAGNVYNYKQEAPNLDFKVSKGKDGIYYVEFIGAKQDLIDYLTGLNWYTEKEIEELNLLKPYKKRN